MEQKHRIIIDKIEYEIIDTKEYITIADSYVVPQNKIGTGNGEAKLYVGSTTDGKTSDFFGNFNADCFYKKHDLLLYLRDIEQEFLYPDQEYRHKHELPTLYREYIAFINNLQDEIISFNIYRSNVEPPRIYINSYDKNYSIIRKICLPNVSYISIMKLKDTKHNIKLYFRPFVDYVGITENSQEEEIKKDNTISETEKEIISKARVGQGKYRERLLENCPICPITLVSDERLLVASHIKPWAKSDNNEKIDPMNGFMLTPTFDKLFDIGFMTFDDNGKMIISNWVSKMTQNKLGIYSGKATRVKDYLNDKRKKYLEYHREYIFKK